MPPERSERTIDLFHQHSPSQFVRKSHGGEGEKEVGSGFPFVWQSVMATYKENEILSQALSLF